MMNGCRQCHAFAKCTSDVVYRGSRCAALRSAYGVESDPEILTNADLIRSMSDEDLAAWAINEAQKIGFRYTSSETGLLKWLQQTAKMAPAASGGGTDMTDQEIIKALRCCATIDGSGCATCISKGLEEDMLSCSDALKILAADRLEELTESQHVMKMREEMRDGQNRTDRRGQP